MLTIKSFNIWDNPLFKKERTEWVIKNVVQQRPDIILLQEVSNANVLEITTVLKQQKYQYKVSNEQGRKTFELIASKWPIQDYKFSHYSTSTQGRGLLWARIRIKDQWVIVATTQLEAGDNPSRRIGQLDCALGFLKSGEPAILGCSTNLAKEEYYDLDPYWSDAWDTGGRNKLAKYTYDSTLNANVEAGIEPCRADRIFYHGFDGQIEYKLFGTMAECGTGKSQVQPSSHFGISLELE